MKKRVELVDKIILMLKSVRTQIQFARLPVRGLIDFLVSDGEFSSLSFLGECLSRLDGGEDFDEAWEKSVKEFSAFSALKSDETGLLLSFAKGLGGTDVNGQISNCDTYTELFSLKNAALKEKSESYVKISGALGVMSAALIALVFI